MVSPSNSLSQSIPTTSSVNDFCHFFSSNSFSNNSLALKQTSSYANLISTYFSSIITVVVLEDSRSIFNALIWLLMVSRWVSSSWEILYFSCMFSPLRVSFSNRSASSSSLTFSLCFVFKLDGFLNEIARCFPQFSLSFSNCVSAIIDTVLPQLALQFDKLFLPSRSSCKSITNSGMQSDFLFLSLHDSFPSLILSSNGFFSGNLTVAILTNIWELIIIINMLRLLLVGKKSLTTLRFGFSNLKQQQNTNAKQEDEEITLAFFYRRLLRNTRVKPNGNSKFNPFDLHYMAKLAEEPHEADLLLEAYYNLQGHNTKISQKTIDIIVQKCIDINPTPDRVLDLYERHYLLGYFPHYTTTRRLAENVKGDAERLERFVGILNLSPFIKMDVETVGVILEGLKEHGLGKQMRRFFVGLIDRAPEILEDVGVVKYLETITNLPHDKISSVVERLHSSKEGKDVHSLARIYINSGKPLAEVVGLLGRLKSLEVEGMEETYERLLRRSKGLYARKPESYQEFVGLYGKGVKGLRKSKEVEELESRILNVQNEEGQNNGEEGEGDGENTK